MSAESNRLQRSLLAAVRVAEATTLALPEGLAFFREFAPETRPGPICPRAGASCNMAGKEWPPSMVASRRPARLDIRRPTVEHRKRYVI